MAATAKLFKKEDVCEVVRPSGSYPAMPSLNNPFVAPGIYNIDGYNFDCREPGLYRFKIPGRAYFLNKIVAKDSSGITDLYSLMSSVSWNQVYGDKDEPTTYPENMTETQLQTISNNGHYRKWRFRCGFVVRFLQWLLPLYGVQCRSIQLHTGETFNEYTDGHVAIETFTGGRWVFWDISNGLYFTDEAGLHLNTQEVIGRFRNGQAPIVVRIDAADKWSSDTPANFDMSLLRDCQVRTPEELDAWHRRVMQIQEMPGYAWLPPGTESKASWLAGRGVQVVSESAFNAMFYP